MTRPTDRGLAVGLTLGAVLALLAALLALLLALAPRAESFIYWTSFGGARSRRTRWIGRGSEAS